MSASSQGEVTAQTGAVNLLFVCNFPPSNLRGGTVLMSRLLHDYPAEQLTVVASSHLDRVSPREGRLPCAHVVFPTTNETGRWGIGRFKTALDWLRIPLLALFIRRLIRRQQVRAILTVADGHFFLAAALAARATGIPYVLVVHDDWVAAQRRYSVLLKYVASPFFGAVARRAAHVYSVSQPMQEAIRERYGVDSEVQLPATRLAAPLAPEPAGAEPVSRELVITYAGTGTGAVNDCLWLMAGLVRDGKLRPHGIPAARFDLYFPPRSDDWLRRHGWDHPSIRMCGWLPQRELMQALSRSDILYLPFTFEESERPWVSWSFPSKAADYIASGKPILVFGPPYSSIVRYARETGFAEVVDQPDPDALARAVGRVASSPALREQLRQCCLAVFAQNHDIERQRAQFRQLLQRLTTLEGACG